MNQLEGNLEKSHGQKDGVCVNGRVHDFLGVVFAGLEGQKL